MKLTLIMLLATLSLSASNKESAAKGKVLYESVCFACHGKNLEGATGHNLKDSLWLHGGTKEQIMSTIKKGFPEKGMVAFGAIYNVKQIEDVANYILSRQEGLRDEYKIFHNATVESGVNWGSQKPNKQAKINPPHFNLNLPEVDQYAIQYKGKLIIPDHLAGTFKLKGLVRQTDGFSLHIDGEKVNIKLPKNKRFEQKLDLTAGSHDIEFRYIKNFKSSTLHLDLIGKAGSIPLSSESYRRSVTNKHIVKAKESFLIIRKRVTGLLPGSIIVNHQDKMNYAINPVNGAVNAVWTGDSLDIGPNIYARGQKAAALLGRQLMAKNESIELSVDGAPRKLKFVGYSDKPKPKFMYKYGSHEIHIESFLGNDGLVLSYRTPSSNSPKIQLRLPKVLNCKAAGGKLEGEAFTPDKSGSFQIIIPVQEKK